MTEGQTILITGGTGSLGYRTAIEIAKTTTDLTVVITGRDPEDTRRKAADIAARTHASVVGLPLDLSSLNDVRRFAADFADHQLPPLHAVVCNAGIQIISGLRLTADGYETTFAVNHLAHFLLIDLLLPSIAAPGRIVMVASDTHDPNKPTGMPAPHYTTALQLARPPADAADTVFAGRQRYTTSKLCNVLMTYELARRLQPNSDSPPITVNAFDPGLMPGTGLARDYTGVQALAWNYLLPALTIVPGLNVHTPRQSARALSRLVTDPALRTVTGSYFSGHREISSSTESYDTAKAADLWTTSLALTGRR